MGDLRLKLIIEDIKQTCPQCQGGGHQAGYSQVGSWNAGVDTRCGACGGKGYKLTEFGRELFETFRPFFAELVEQNRSSTKNKSLPHSKTRPL